MNSTDLGLLIMIGVLLVPSVLIVRALIKGAGFELHDAPRTRRIPFSLDYTSADLANINKQSMLNIENHDKYNGL